MRGFDRLASASSIWLCVVITISACICHAQQRARVVTGGMNAEFTVSDQEHSIAFYRDALGLGEPIARVNPALPGVGQLTGTITGAAHVARLPIPGASWTMEIVETTGVERKPVAGRRQDIGASGLILYVRDIDRTIATLKNSGATFVTVGGRAIHVQRKNAGYRAIVARDPNDFFIEVRQMDQLPATTAPASSNVVGAAISISVENTDKTARYWREILDFDVDTSASFSREKSELALQGTPGAEIRTSIAAYPGSDVVFELLEFKGIDRAALHPHTQDPGSGAFALTCGDMSSLVSRLRSNPEGKILTVGNNALNQGARIAMFFQDLNGFVFEAIQRVDNGRSGK